MSRGVQIVAVLSQKKQKHIRASTLKADGGCDSESRRGHDAVILSDGWESYLKKMPPLYTAKAKQTVNK